MTVSVFALIAFGLSCFSCGALLGEYIAKRATRRNQRIVINAGPYVSALIDDGRKRRRIP